MFKMDTIVVAVLALLAAGYLFWRFRAAVKGKDSRCGCGTCGSACSCSGSACESSQRLDYPHDKPTKAESGDWYPGFPIRG